MSLMPFQINEYLTKKIVQDLAIECSNATQVIVQQGAVVGADDGGDILVVPSAITLDITTSGLGGLDTGSETADTWYYIWLIKDQFTGTVAGLLSASSVSPTLPVGFTIKRLVGAVRNDGSGDFLQFTQIDSSVEYKDYYNVFSAGQSTWVSVDASNYVPQISCILDSFTFVSNADSTGARGFVLPGLLSGTGSGGRQIVYGSASQNSSGSGSPAVFQIDNNQAFSTYHHGSGYHNISVIGFTLNL